MAHIYNKNGEVLSEKTEVIGRRKKHLDGWSQETDGPYQNMPWREIPLKDDLKIAKEEVRRHVRRLKMRKAPGICGFVPEILKAGGEVVVEWMAEVFNMVWKEGMAPDDWKNAVIVPVCKKGSRLD